jgi:acetyl-CoA carboxylase carboxyl transferase subunit alpha
MDKPKFTLEFEKPLRDLEEQLSRLHKSMEENAVDVSTEIRAIERKIEETKRIIYSNLNAWQKVQLARHPRRPYALDYIAAAFDDFQELHGDRLYRDDEAIVGGTAFFRGRPVMVIGQQKGRNTKENLRRNFGCPNPEGYRKALRLMRLAEKFKLPVITLIDTPGAYPGIGAEERHVAEAIAVNLREMARFQVPIIAVVIGEGGSGGALGLAVADRVLIMQNAYYSVISPEGCAAILWKDRAHAARAAEALKITSEKLLELGVVDAIVNEPFGGAHNDPDEAAKQLADMIEENLKAVAALSTEKRLQLRYDKFRRMGEFEENALTSAE